MEVDQIGVLPIILLRRGANFYFSNLKQRHASRSSACAEYAGGFGSLRHVVRSSDTNPSSTQLRSRSKTRRGGGKFKRVSGALVVFIGSIDALGGDNCVQHGLICKIVKNALSARSLSSRMALSKLLAQSAGGRHASPTADRRSISDIL